jgi:hypothetical protein
MSFPIKRTKSCLPQISNRELYPFCPCCSHTALLWPNYIFHDNSRIPVQRTGIKFELQLSPRQVALDRGERTTPEAIYYSKSEQNHRNRLLANKTLSHMNNTPQEHRDEIISHAITQVQKTIKSYLDKFLHDMIHCTTDSRFHKTLQTFQNELDIFLNQSEATLNHLLLHDNIHRTGAKCGFETNYLHEIQILFKTHFLQQLHIDSSIQTYIQQNFDYTIQYLLRYYLTRRGIIFDAVRDIHSTQDHFTERELMRIHEASGPYPIAFELPHPFAKFSKPPQKLIFARSPPDSKEILFTRAP